eukprot:CAMPEP_0171110738 /NCGR_PEP_ID=MMETSP0766_2-20121228/72400_1 /TAXON_ID=439317 /ORGANISM="Gambierdiscus australes, Strain CAWD 149" /LENGTH=89 /DNA_ID=CAMNT_0011572651 /DNA_START=724 /DNA_END=989 /DNA_ORIENTATION=-
MLEPPATVRLVVLPPAVIPRAVRPDLHTVAVSEGAEPLTCVSGAILEDVGMPVRLLGEGWSHTDEFHDFHALCLSLLADTPAMLVTLAV